MIEQELLGRVVLYRMSDFTLSRVAALDGDGNRPRRGDLLPMLITRDWGDGLVNGTLFLDGADTLWVTSVKEGGLDGEFQIPVKLSEIRKLY